MLHHTLLGLLARRPSSGYDIGNWLRMEGRWLGRGPSMTPVHRALAEIEQRGWVSTRVQKRDSAPDATIYSLTPTGVHALTEWAATEHQPAERPMAPDSTQRLSFAGQLGPEYALAIVRTELEFRRRQRAADGTSGIDYSRLTSTSGATAMTKNDKGELMGTEPGRTGYYTKDDYRRLVEYAASRAMAVVPEIDVPGHTNAALHAIPQLNSAGSLPRPADGEETPPANGTPNVGYSSLDVDNPANYDFVRTVMGELAQLTPGPFLHMDGDESHSTSEADNREMVTRFASTVAETGKRVMGWNEYAAGDLPVGAVVQHRGEWIRGIAQMDDYLWPRALATAEVAWSPQSARVTEDFVDRAEHVMAALQLAGVNPHPVPELDAVGVVSARRRGDGARVSLQVRASAASAEPSAVTAHSVEASGRTREVPLSSEADLSAPMVESSAVHGSLGGIDPRRPPQLVELLVDGQVVAETVEIP